MVNETTIKYSGRSTLLLLAGCSAFVLVGMFLLASGDGGFVAWMTILFFGAGIPLGVYRMFDTRPKLVLNSRGIEDRRIRLGIIAWSDIQSVNVWRMSSQTFLSVNLKAETAYLPNLSPMQRKAAEFYRRIGFPTFPLSISDLDLPPVQIEALVNQYLARYGKS